MAIMDFQEDLAIACSPDINLETVLDSTKDNECFFKLFSGGMELFKSIYVGKIKSADEAVTKFQAQAKDFDGCLTLKKSVVEKKAKDKLKTEMAKLVKKYASQLIQRAATKK